MSVAHATGTPGEDPGDKPNLEVVRLDRRGRRIAPHKLKGRSPVHKGSSLEPDPLTPEEIWQLLQAVKPRDNGERNRLAALRLSAFIVIAWRTGARVTEIVNIQEGDLHRGPGQDMIFIRSGKGKKPRHVALDPWGWKQVDAWMLERRKLKPGAVICVVHGPSQGMPWLTSDIRRELKRLAREAGITKAVRPHGFRHSHMMELLLEGVALDALSTQAGHSRSETTLIYLRKLGADQRLAAILNRPRPTIPLPDLPMT